MAAPRVLTREQYWMLEARKMREVPDLTAIVIRLAMSLGWLTSHQRPSRMKSGRYATAVQGSVGFPDLVLTSMETGRTLFRELKSQKGQLEPAQRLWLDSLRRGGADVDVWRPYDYFSGRITRELGGVHMEEAPTEAGASPSDR